MSPRWPRCSTQQADGPVVVVGHSFGGAVALHLAAARPDRVAALVLLDPAIGLDGEWMREIADAMLASPDYPDAAEARAEKATGSWADVDPAVLDAELDEHLDRAAERAVRLADQPAGDDVLLERVGPRYRVAAQRNSDDVGAGGADRRRRMSPIELIDGLRERLGTRFSAAGFRLRPHGADAKPAEVAALIRERMPLTVAPVTDEQVERVRALVAAIPSGRVATYGDIAAAAGLSSPRIVGWIMRTDSSDLPWHRVITASGRPARHLTTRQLELLRAEGVLAVDGRVALARSARVLSCRPSVA